MNGQLYQFTLTNRLITAALIRFPMPYEVEESQHPGNAEKLRCEAAAFI
jgi:hypothetical protein